jgi:serine O-acetyltransferase
MTVIKLIMSDYKKYKKYGGRFFSIVFFTQGFWAVCQYRIAHFVHTRVLWLPFRILLLGVTLLWQKGIEISTGISIPASAIIGHSFYIGHFGGIIINAKAIIGHNCNISQGVTIGVSGLGEKRGVPIIGNNVYIGVNSVVAGKIEIADDVLIGACSLVTSSAEKAAVLVGVPAVKVSNDGSRAYL